MSKARSTGNIGNIIKTSATCVTVNDGTTDLLIMSGSGTVTIPGNLVVLGGIAGSSAESSSYSLSSSFATNANTLDGIDGASFLQTGSFNTFSSSIDTTIKNKLNGDGVISGSVQVDITNTTGYSTLSGSIATTTSGLAGRITTVEGNYVTTGSNTFIGTQTITGSICTNGNIVTTGQIVAQTINVQQVTSSIVYSCGSNIFGCSISNIQQFTGSLQVTGSNHYLLGNVAVGSSTSSGQLTVASTGADGIVLSPDTGDCNNSGRIFFVRTGGEGWSILNNSSILSFRSGGVPGTTSGTNKLGITTDGVATFVCQVCTPHLVGSNNVSIGSNCTVTSGYNTRLRITNIANDSFVFAFNNQACKPIMQMYGGNINNPQGYTAWLDNTTDNLNHIISHNTAEATYFASQGGNVGIGTSSLVTTCTNGALTIVKKHNLDTPPSVTAQCYYCNQSGLYIFGRNSGISLISSTNEESRIQFAGPSSEWFAAIGATSLNSPVGGTLYFRTGASNTNRFYIDNVGISYFSCQVCAPNAVISNCLGIGGTPLSELYIGGGSMRIDGTTPFIYLRGGSTGAKGAITLNHFGYTDFSINAGCSGNYILGITKTPGGTDGILLHCNGNVGIGRIPSYKLDVNGGIRVSEGGIQMGSLPIQYPYARLDSYEHDGTGFFWGLGVKSGGVQKINAFFVGAARTFHAVDDLKVVSWVSNEFNSSYPSYSVPINLHATSTSYINTGAQFIIGRSSFCNSFSFANTETSNGATWLGPLSLGNSGGGIEVSPLYCGGGKRWSIGWNSGDMNALINYNNCTPFLFSWGINGDNPPADRKFCFNYNGQAYSTSGTWGTLSSNCVIKENITVANSQWNDIKNICIVNYKMKEEIEEFGSAARLHLGVVAEQVAEVSPGLLEEGGYSQKWCTCLNGVKTSILHMKAVKALQEAMCRIEILESCLGIN